MWGFIIFIWMFMILAFIFILSSQSPFMMCLSLIFMVMMLGSMLHFMGSIWLMYTLIIMFLGGMMIVFVYAASMNNMFKFFTSHYNAFIMSLISMVTIIYFSHSEFYFSNSQSAVWIFPSSSSYSFIFFISSIIILSLFIVVKLVQIEQGPLKM